MLLLYSFSLIRVGNYKQSFTWHKNVLVELANVRFERAKWAAKFEHDETKKDFLKRVSKNGESKARFRQSLSDAYSKEKNRTRNVM